MTVELRPMTEEEFGNWSRHARAGYAESVRTEMGYTEQAAREKAKREFTELLPAGLATHGQWLLVAITQDGDVVGYLWFGERIFGGRRIAFVWDIEVVEGARGRGFGRAIMTALEDRVRDLGIDRIDLNVFGRNRVARALYRSLGYEETSIVMSKRL